MRRRGRANRGVVHEVGERVVLGRDAADVVPGEGPSRGRPFSRRDAACARLQRDVHHAVHVGPLRMMVAAFGVERDARHETERLRRERCHKRPPPTGGDRARLVEVLSFIRLVPLLMYLGTRSYTKILMC